MPRIISLLGAALALLLLLPGCSAIKFVYNSAPELTYWWVDGYVDLDDSQSPKVKEELTALHQWHRRAELPLYADMVQRAAQMATADVSPEQVCAVINEGRGRLVALADHAEPAAAALAVSLNTEQLRGLEKRYAKNNKEYRKEWVDATPEERTKRRMKLVLDRSEMIYGKLDDKQRDLIREQIQASSFDPAVSYAEHLRRQRDTLQTLTRLLTEKPAPVQARALLRANLERSMESPNPAYRTYERGLMNETCKGFSVAHNSTTAAQRDTASKRLKAYERDLRELASIQR